MRIAWIVHGDLAQTTGGYVYDRLVVLGLRARGDEVELVDPLVTSVAAGGCEDADVLVGDALCVRELGPLFERVESDRPRVLLVHHLPSWELERGDRDEMRGFEARALAASDHVIATSVATRQRLMGARASVPVDRGAPVDVVVPGADRLRTVPRPEGSSAAPGRGNRARVELLFVGSLVARKRVELLLDALESLPGSGVALTLLGALDREPAYARAIARRIEASDALRSTVTMAGVAGDDALAGWLARADALVLPSSLEGYGMVLTEALHAGLPVIAARPAAEAAAVAHLGAVRVFDHARDLAELLRRFVDDPVLREAMGRAAAATLLPTWAEAIAAFRIALVCAQRRRP